MMDTLFAYCPNDWYWIVGGDETQVYSSARAAFVPADDAVYQAWRLDIPSEHLPTRIVSMDDLIAVLREADVPPYHRVRKSIVVARLTDAQLEAALGTMTLRQRERWYAPDQPAVNADDPDTVAIIRAVGADLPMVLAPE